ncbi:MAG: DUF3644 domain-containing protein [Caldilineaceae bacterium]|nr:DUF3644 domain-containing protein [Caldilineaceae bacterium]
MKSRSQELLDRSVAATVAAIEIYNKPDFPYRSESFCILAINGWELLMKAKWLSENDNKIRSLYVMENLKKKDGTKSKRQRIKRTRAKIPFTLGLDYLAKKLVEQNHLDSLAYANIEALLELRDTSVHFYHQSEMELALSLQEVGAACLRNFVLAVKEWFDRDLSDCGFFLIPLSFVGTSRNQDAIVLNREEESFLKYLHQLVKGAEEVDSDYAVAINIDMKFTRSQAKDAIEVRFSQSPDALEVRLTEEQILKQYPWRYRRLTDECGKAFSNFKCNQKYHDIRKALYGDKKYCYIRLAYPENPDSQQTVYFKPTIMQELNRHYTRR